MKILFKYPLLFTILTCLTGCNIVSPLFFGADTHAYLVMESADRIYVLGRCGADIWIVEPDSIGNFEIITQDLPSSQTKEWDYLVSDNDFIITNDEYTISVDNKGEEMWVADTGGHTITKKGNDFLVFADYGSHFINNSGRVARSREIGGLPGSGYYAQIGKIIILKENRILVEYPEDTISDTIAINQDPDTHLRAEHMVVANGGSIFVTGTVYNDTLHNDAVFINRYSIEGSLISTVFEKLEPSVHIHASHLDPQDNFYISVDYTDQWLPSYDGDILSFSTSGEKNQTYTFLGSHSETYANSILISESGELYLAGDTYYNSPGHSSGTEGLMAKFHLDGEQVWLYEFEGEDFDSGLLNK